MNKATLISTISRKTGVPVKQAETVLNAMIETVTETLLNGERVQIVGFGSFEVRERAEHTARNPATGEQVRAKATRTPCFRPGKLYKKKF